MLMTLFILTSVQGLVLSDDETYVQSCNEILKNNSRTDHNNTIPDPGELLVYCPIIKEFIDCEIRNVDPYHMDHILATRSFLDDLCNETSETHKAYADNIDCFRSIQNEWSGCTQIASDVLEEYVESGYAFQITQELDEDQENVKDYYIYIERYCLLNVYPYICLGKKMLETCESGAYDTYIDFVTRIRLADDLCHSVILKPFKKGYTEFLSNGNKTSEIPMFHDVLSVNID